LYSEALLACQRYFGWKKDHTQTVLAFIAEASEQFIKNPEQQKTEKVETTNARIGQRLNNTVEPFVADMSQSTRRKRYKIQSQKGGRAIKPLLDEEEATGFYLVERLRIGYTTKDGQVIKSLYRVHFELLRQVINAALEIMQKGRSEYGSRTRAFEFAAEKVFKTRRKQPLAEPSANSENAIKFETNTESDSETEAKIFFDKAAQNKFDNKFMKHVFWAWELAQKDGWSILQFDEWLRERLLKDLETVFQKIENSIPLDLQNDGQGDRLEANPLTFNLMDKGTPENDAENQFDGRVLEYMSSNADCIETEKEHAPPCSLEYSDLQPLEQTKLTLTVFEAVGAHKIGLTLKHETNDKFTRYEETTAKEHIEKLWNYTQFNDAGFSVIARPILREKESRLVQQDDLNRNTLEKLLPFAFLAFETSPNRFQAWIATNAPQNYLYVERGLCKALGTDKGASGATRLPGTKNMKPGRDGCLIRLIKAKGQIVKVDELEKAFGFDIQKMIDEEAKPLFSATENPNTKKWNGRSFPSYSMTRGKTASERDASFLKTCLNWGIPESEAIAELVRQAGRKKHKSRDYMERTLKFVANH
jgi:hypothetical protein